MEKHPSGTRLVGCSLVAWEQYYDYYTFSNNVRRGRIINILGLVPGGQPIERTRRRAQQTVLVRDNLRRSGERGDPV